MSNRVTKKMLRNMVQHLNDALGRPAKGWERVGQRNVGQIGHLELEVMSPGDGWTRYTLHEIANEGGGVSTRSLCCTSQEMYAVLDTLKRALLWGEFPNLKRSANWLDCICGSGHECSALAERKANKGTVSSEPVPTEAALADAVLEWARTPGNHGGNPYGHAFVALAQKIKGE